MKQYHLHGYHVGENGVVFISNAQGKVETALDRIKNNVEANYEKETIVIKTKVLAGNKTIDRYTCMQSIISFCTEVGSRLAYIDYLTNIYNRNALERDLNAIQKRENIYYFYCRFE